MNLTLEPLVVSTTSISDYRRCRKKYELSWVLNRDVPSSEAAERGTNFHEILHAVARRDRDWLQEHSGDPMYQVALEYLKRHGFPSNVLAAEEPIYTEVLPESHEFGPAGSVIVLPAVYIRSTHDLVYRDEHEWIVVRDYKTFTVRPTINVDLDFQGRLYIANTMKYFRTDNVRFEYECVRQDLRRELKGKGLVDWPDEDRYVRVPLLVAGHEITQLWEELRADCDELRRKLRNPATIWTRTDLKTGPHSCNSCFHNQLCSAQLQQSGLTDDTLNFHSTPRDPADRMTARAILADPRVAFWTEKFTFTDSAQDAGGRALDDAVFRVYGQSGRTLVSKLAARERQAISA